MSAQVDNDFAFEPVGAEHRRGTWPLLTLAFGWGFLVTGLIVGGGLGNGMPFSDLLAATAIGNVINFLIAGLVAYIGFSTGCNSALLFRWIFGNRGGRYPVLAVAALTICWQGIIVGAFGFAFTQSFESYAFYATAIFGGLLFTATTFYGMRGLEIVSFPAAFVLIAVGLYAGWINIDAAGGWSGFLSLSTEAAKKDPLTLAEGINLVVGSWIVGAIVMPEYTRFAKKAWVAIAIPFIVMIVAQWFLQILGALGGVVSGSYDFTTYMLAQGAIVGAIGVTAMAIALWTTGDTNLYLPSVMLSSEFGRPQKHMTIICGLIGTVLGLGIYAQFMDWINLLASLAPPLIGPLLVEFYLFGKRKVELDQSQISNWNWAAFAAIGLGCAATQLSPAMVPSSLVGLATSCIGYVIFKAVWRTSATTPIG
jgi:cytosine permease